MNDKERLLFTLLDESVRKCYKEDKILIERSMEQASVARIFYYMQVAIICDEKFANFRVYNLDSEYNKNGEEIKETPRCQNGTRPDIILHKRNQHDNLLVAEFKSYKGSFKKLKGTDKKIDFVKLEDFTEQCTYNYKLGVSVKLNKKSIKYIFFKNGKEEQTLTIKI